jgi:hypothetical protein
LLFGAPRAFATGRLQVINDTLSPSSRPRALAFSDTKPATPGRFYLQPELPEEVRVEITRYFKDRAEQLRSFASIPLRPPEAERETLEHYGTVPIAILNIQSNQPKVLGSPSAWNTLLTRIEPLLQMLAAYISRLRIILARTHLEH